MAPVDAAAYRSLIDLEKIPPFPQGIPGFETYTRGRIFHKEENIGGTDWPEIQLGPSITGPADSDCLNRAGAGTRRRNPRGSGR